jgi:IMP dehydrogenase
MNHSVEAFVNRKIVTLHEDSTAFQASKAMCENQVGCVVVLDAQKHVAGILTDRDLACGVIATGRGSETSLREFMTPNPVWVTEDASVEDIVQLMARYGIRRIPVVHQGSGGRQRCVGLVSLDDIIASEEIGVSHLSQVVRAQIRRFYQTRPPKPEIDSISKEFLTVLSRRTRLSADETKVLARFVLGAIVRRLHYTAAVQFIL